MIRETSVDSVELRFASDTCHGCVYLFTFGSVSFKQVISFLGLSFPDCESHFAATHCQLPL